MAALYIAIEQDSKVLFAVMAQDAWPGPKGHLFCIRDGSEREERDLFVEKERVPVLQFERFSSGRFKDSERRESWFARAAAALPDGFQALYIGKAERALHSLRLSTFFS